MNYRMILYTIGNLFKVTAGLLVLPLIVSLIYQDGCYLSFIFPIIGTLIIGFLCTFWKPKNTAIYAREGFVIVGLSWILISLVGALPFVISGEIPNFIDAFFETVSGFTTTGASILEADVLDNMAKSMIFWRSFTHWIGGMGVLVFILAILPTSDAQNIFILRAESPGPQVGKLVSKVKFTAQILYLIYLGMTIIETLMLWIGGIDGGFFAAITMSFGTAGTGGFGIVSSSCGDYSVYCQTVIGVFMLLFGINFNIYYLILIGKAKQALKSEELWWYLGIVGIAIGLITTDLVLVSNLYDTLGWGMALKDAFFQVASIITTTGYATTDFNLWPELSKVILVLLMFIGACAGSTGGGLKVSRLAIMVKSIKRNINKLLHPTQISNIRFEGQIVEDDVVNGVTGYFGLLMILTAVGFLILSFDDFGDFTTNFTAEIACINNIGPGLNLVGPSGNYYGYNVVSKITLIVSMLIGRLEIYPILLLFFPKTWRHR